jgi:RNA polymerase sigma-32 factor
MKAPAFDCGLTRYLRDIQKFPLLTADEEQHLAKRWREEGDVRASQRLVTSHLRLIVKIAKDYAGYGLPLSDIISAGHIGMMQAVNRFELGRGARLATYASLWIRAAIQDHILHSWSLVRIGTTAAQKKLFFNLRRLKAQMRVVEEGDLSPENVGKIATTLDVPEEDVISVNRRLFGRDHTLNAPRREGDDWQDFLVDEAADQETVLAEREERNHRRAILADAMNTLSERERQILSARHLTDQPLRLQDLTQEYDISRERVRQIEVRAIKKLRQAASANAEMLCGAF